MTREYTILFNAVTDAISNMEKSLQVLKSAQQQAEEEYVTRMENIKKLQP